VLADDPLALPEHTPEWVDAICAVGPFSNATRLYEFADGRRLLTATQDDGLGANSRLWR
jgi:hypothetical protein